uniref:ATP-sensitive inward rectifier potassium channel 12-like isoform X2 n=1 Tax=Ciona intestinalis TaxID=7719 RepID=UPI0005212D4E|nr:ATP-sensitive inward rectifier potassium channel 12-like isoform X2 [Ciona intestinalis]|eukprot:XP_009859945.1 ATP-sensitive inward rectifier potassium channel 12-like isoform X2 [Ciona intestinalis]
MDNMGLRRGRVENYGLPGLRHSSLRNGCTLRNISELPSVSGSVEIHNQSNMNNLRKVSNSSSLQGMMTYHMEEDDQVKERSNLISHKGVRFIKKTGHCNVSHSNLTDKPRRFIADIFTTGVDLKWRWNLFVFSAAFVVSWICFALVFWLISYLHGDFAVRAANESFTPCVNNLDINHPFTSSFLFSLETQTTIGYGFRVVTEECPFTVFMVVVQSVFGCILDAFMIGLIMAKISRPKKRAETLMFSNKAVINMRDGQLCLMVRVGNLRKSHLVEATIRMQYIHSRETLEGEFIPLEQIDLHLDLKNDSDRLFLVTPQTICHPIDENSPLWELNAEDLPHANFEVILILEGMVEATGMTTQARASYLPNEILWGHRFQNMISFTRNNGYKVNFGKFNKTYMTPNSPHQSAKYLSCASNSEMNTLVESSMNNNKKNRQADSESSSISSIHSHQHDPSSSASDGKDSGYTAVEDLTRAYSSQTLNTENNKVLTSTTSLSDESEDNKTVSESERMGSLVNSRKSLPSSELLVDVAEEISPGKGATLVRVGEIELHKAPSNGSLKTSSSFRSAINKSNPQYSDVTVQQAKSSDDIRLLLMRGRSGDEQLAQSNAEKSFIECENNALCV